MTLEATCPGAAILEHDSTHDKMSMASKRVLITGYYGMKNTGDDAMAYCLVRGIHRFRPDLEITIAASGGMVLPESSRDRVAFVPRRPGAVVRELRNCQAVIWGGGTALFHYPGRNWKWFRMLARQAVLFRMARVLGKKVFLVGIGLGPFHARWSRLLAKYAVDAAEHVSLRDRAGYAFAESWGLDGRAIEGFDLSALLLDSRETSGTRPRGQGRVLGLSLLPFYEVFHNDASHDLSLRRHFADSIRACLSIYDDLTIRLFVFKGPDKDHDEGFLQSLCRELDAGYRVRVVSYNPDPRRRLEEVAQCHFFMGMRLHASIFAYLCDLPMIVLDYHAKCRAFHDQVQLPPRAILDLTQMESHTLAKRMSELISVPGAFRASLPREVARQKAWNMIEELMHHL